ncbi:hypothetical protein BuS5_03582 [Desulfosarcina sp. BuS5]|uniref:hypothetical protein n=1 Tax=Desulfosarcina sp. BuS5 TaxID=933262 RepID=UPI0012FBEC58|nr:hypothetical protein [Desulfosarcina sp. BuS5]WDN90611.1 hypothetical protein BuS5_03582 [Desulfosarcina sp. BuS5]
MYDGCWSDSEAEIVVTNVEFEMLADTNTNLVLSMQPALVDFPAKLCQLSGDRLNLSSASFKALFD